MKFECSLLLLLSAPFMTALVNEGNDDVPSIGIIGAGIGGVSSAYFLEQLFGKGKCEIDVYEADQVGGRLRTVNVSGYEYEEGGSIIHPRNQYVRQFAKLVDLEAKESGNEKVGIYNGEKFVFVESNSMIITAAKFLYQYGFNMMKMELAISSMLDKFDRIYTAQAKGEAFNSVAELLTAMDPSFINMTETSSEDGFRSDGYGHHFTDEIIMSALMVNYGQTLSAQKFVGSVSMAGADSGVWSVFGGNKQIPERLLQGTDGNLIKDHVASVAQLDDGTYSIKTKSGQEKIYDLVILAAPLTQSGIEFQNILKPHTIGEYHVTVNTLVNGKLNAGHFGWKEGRPEADQILVCKDGLAYNSLARVTPVDYISDKEDEYPQVWKVFSKAELTKEELEALFEDINEVVVRNWRAYPHYSSNQELGSFILAPNLYHVNAIEWAASAMEMSCIGAKNVALLAFRDWTNSTIMAEEKSNKDEL